MATDKQPEKATSDQERRNRLLDAPYSRSEEDEKNNATSNNDNTQDNLKSTLDTDGLSEIRRMQKEAQDMLDSLWKMNSSPDTAPKKTSAESGHPIDTAPTPSYPPAVPRINDLETRRWDSRDRIFNQAIPYFQNEHFDKPGLWHKNTTKLTDKNSLLSGQVGWDIGTQEGRTAELKPYTSRTDSPETPDFAQRNLTNERAFLKWLRDSKDPEYQYLTSPTVKPTDYVQKIGDSAYTRALEIAREKNLRTGDNSDLKKLREAARKAGAPLYPKWVPHMTELGNAYNNPKGKRWEDGNMYFSGQYLGKIMYDKNHAQNNPDGSGKQGTSWSTMVQLDQGLTIWGKEVIPKGYMMRIGTGMIYDEKGNYAWNFETNGSLFDRALRVHLNPQMIQFGLENNSSDRL